jgi:hypothetical protein
MRDYWRGLLSLRMSDHGRVFRLAEVPDSHYRWITPDEGTLLGYVVGERVLVLANSGTDAGEFQVTIPDGGWRQVGDRQRVDLRGAGGTYARLSGGAQSIHLPGGAFLIWVLEQ